MNVAIRKQSAEVFGSEPNSSAVRSHSRTMNTSRFRFYEPQRKASCACLCATPLPRLGIAYHSVNQNSLFHPGVAAISQAVEPRWVSG